MSRFMKGDHVLVVVEVKEDGPDYDNGVNTTFGYVNVSLIVGKAVPTYSYEMFDDD